MYFFAQSFDKTNQIPTAKRQGTKTQGPWFWPCSRQARHTRRRSNKSSCRELNSQTWHRHNYFNSNAHAHQDSSAQQPQVIYASMEPIRKSSESMSVCTGFMIVLYISLTSFIVAYITLFNQGISGLMNTIIDLWDHMKQGIDAKYV